MKKYFLIIVFLNFGCALNSATKINSIKSEVDHFKNMDACFLLYNMKTQKFERVYGEARCREQVAPCSTFKVPLAVMGFDSGILKDEHTQFKWDGEKRIIDSWNQDHTAETWMKNSVVWYSQKITPKIGEKKILKYLADFSYGNQDFSGGLNDAWLTSTPFSKLSVKSTLKISAFEQISFMEKLWNKKLPASKRAMELTQKIIFLENSSNGFSLHGKTGSGFVENDTNLRIGWFVSHVEGKDKEYLTVLTFTDTLKQERASYAGLQSKEMTKKILAAEGLW